MKLQKIIFETKETAALKSEEIPDLAPAPDEICGRTLASVVSPGTELSLYRGLVGNFPSSSGYAAVFEVTEVGQNVTRFKKGDRAFCMGPHQSLQKEKEAHAVRLPEGLAPEKAAFARLCGVAMTTLLTTVARPPARTMVTGLGIVGHLAAQIFQACGYEVTACDPMESRRALAMHNGLTDVRDSIPLNDPKVAGQISLCVECSGHEQAVLDACKMSRKRGEVALVGVPWTRRTDAFAFDLLHAVFHRYVVVRSGWEWEAPLLPADFREGSIYGNFAGAMRWIAKGRIKLDGIYERHHPEEAETVYHNLNTVKSACLTAAFDWT